MFFFSLFRDQKVVWVVRFLDNNGHSDFFLNQLQDCLCRIVEKNLKTMPNQKHTLRLIAEIAIFSRMDLQIQRSPHQDSR